MSTIDTILQYGYIRFVRTGRYMYVRMGVSVLREDGTLVNKLYARYGGRIDRSVYVHRWEVSHARDIRAAALDVLRHIGTGAITRATMSIMIRYCETSHGGRSRYATGMRELYDASSIQLSKLVDHRRL